MCSFEGALHIAKYYLNWTNAPKPPYKGNGWLEKISNEYQQRFGIDFTKRPVRFARIQELVLPRNTGIHRLDVILETYLDKIKKPRFVDGEDRTEARCAALIR